MKPPMTPHDLVKSGKLDNESLRQHLDKVYNTLTNISFGSTKVSAAPAPGGSTTVKDADMNFDGQKVVATSPAVPNTEFAIPHSLGRVPMGFVYLGGSNPGVVYISNVTPWSATQVFLKETQGGNTFTILLV